MDGVARAMRISAANAQKHRVTVERRDQRVRSAAAEFTECGRSGGRTVRQVRWTRDGQMLAVWRVLQDSLTADIVAQTATVTARSAAMTPDVKGGHQAINGIAERGV